MTTETESLAASTLRTPGLSHYRRVSRGLVDLSPIPAAVWILGILLLIVSWCAFVFAGSQIGYLIATVISCGIAIELGRRESAMVISFIAAVIALIGPDASGALAAGRPILGSLRLLDATVAAALLASVVTLLRQKKWHWFLGAHRAGGLVPLALVSLTYALARWFMEGHHIDRFLRTDLRLAGIGLAVAFLLWSSRRGGTIAMLISLAAISVLAAAKAIAIHWSGLFAIGSYDRIQAASYVSGGRLRTSLDGGDTLLILAPALVLLLAWEATSTMRRIALLASAALCFYAVSLSATRTSFLVCVGLCSCVAVAQTLRDYRLVNRRTIGALVVALGLIATLAFLSGVASRLTQSDAPHVGLNFRLDEIRSFLRLPAAQKYLGQGFGGRFESKDVNGHPVATAWAHDLPVWLALKDGILGLVLAVAALGLILRRLTRAFRVQARRMCSTAGAAIVIGIVLISMTIDRVALVDGLVLFIIGVWLIPRGPRSVMAGS